jgi:hypothetical protein
MFHFLNAMAQMLGYIYERGEGRGIRGNTRKKLTCHEIDPLIEACMANESMATNGSPVIKARNSLKSSLIMQRSLKLRGLIWSVLAWSYWLAFYAEAAEKSAAYRAALESITSADLTQYVDRLADPKLEGREAGTSGNRAAAAYLVEQFTKFHLRAAGNGDGFEQPFPPNYCNLLGMIEGNDPVLKDEVIVVGAHYDHIGYGNRGNSYGPIGRVHPGADDNASGTAAIVELARVFSFLPDPPKRTILLAAWDAEEKGLYGSKYWVSHPTVSLEKIVASIDLDMIGRLRDDHVYVFGARSGCGWRRIVSRANYDLGLQLDFSWRRLMPEADYYPFFSNGIPVLMFHTGLHENYHRPSDTADLINGQGMSRVVRLLFGVVYELAESDEKIPYRQAAARETPETERFIIGQITRPVERLGVSMDSKPATEGGVRLSRVAGGSSAEKAGLKPGDRILSCDGREIQSDEDLIGDIMAAESPVKLVLQHPEGEKPAEISVELAGRPLRLGITWRVDDAEPGTIILTYIVPGSPAARAGLQAGDRIYQVAGKDFADEAAFLELANTLPEPLELLVDRDGRLLNVVIRIMQAELIKRAA